MYEIERRQKSLYSYEKWNDEYTDDDGLMKMSRRRRFYCLSALMGVLIIILILGLPTVAVFLSTGDDDSSTAKFDGSGLNFLNRLITSIGPMDQSTKDAYDWITTIDPLHMTQDPQIPAWRIQQRFVLAKLYFSTNGPNWTDPLDFLTTKNECLWMNGVYQQQQKNATGVTGCINGQIYAIRLPNNNLVGTLPPELSMLLPELRELVFPNNTLMGTLPSGYSQLAKITWFDVGNNALTGTLPPEYGEWTDLKGLSLERKHFIGSLPSDYGKWTNLEQFFVYDNTLTGTIPTEYGNWSPSIVSMDRNKLMGTLPPSLGFAWKDT